MPWTLWRYIFLEVGRLVLISTAVLVTVIAFAATVKPLADGKLTAVDAIRFMGYAIPPMLAYALPFAAGFGATLAYHRLAQDNEVTACSAGGLSYLRVLAPAIGVGAVLSVGLLALNAQIIPRFLTRMERLITKDVAQVMVRSLEQGEPARLGNNEFYADAVSQLPAEGDGVDRILLTGVVAVQLDDQGNVEVDMTAERAWVLMFSASHLDEDERANFRPDDTVIRIQFVNPYRYDHKSGGQQGLKEFFTPPVALPNAFKDDPKFLTSGGLRRLRAEPERMNWIDERRLDLARDLAASSTIGALQRRIEDVQSASLDGPNGQGVRIQTARLVWERDHDRWRADPLEPGSLVEVEMRTQGGSLERYGAQRAYLSAKLSNEQSPFAESVEGSLVFSLDLYDVTIRPGVSASAIAASNNVPQMKFEGLTAPNDPFRDLRRKSSAELIAAAKALGDSGNNKIARAAERLQSDIAKLGREITSKQHERLAMDLSCVVMVFTGALMALRLKTALPLVVYLWSFFPALGTIILISSGQQTTHREGWIGLPILWAGVFGLAGFAAVVYLKLRKH